MGKIITLKKARIILPKLKDKHQSIVLVGGCFDILHIGHIRFLEHAKKLGGKLFVLVETDKKVRELKGKNRPLFSQNQRAHALSSLRSVDYIVLLPYLKDSDYDDVITSFKPDIIACTENDPILDKKKRQIAKVSGKLIILPYFSSLSSSKIASLLAKENL